MMPQYNSQNDSCNIENCKRCINKLHCLKYLEHLERMTSSSDIVGTSMVSPSMSELSIDIDEIKNKLDSLCNEISAKLNDVGTLKKNKPNKSTSIIDVEQAENGLMVYGADAPTMQPGDEYWEEKKNLFGGSKMVKKTIK